MRDLSIDESASLTAGGAMWSSVAIPDAGVVSFTMADGPMGIASGRIDERDVSLLSPCPTALGASWDIALCRRVGMLIGGEAVARGVDAILAPNLNLARSPLAGRAFEYFSEDPVLAGVLGAAWIEGVQSTGTGAVAKHVVCNDSETDRDTIDVQVDERTLREVYLLPFELAAQAGCVGMLAAYNKVNGDWCAEQAHVLSDIIKGEWGYGGLIMSDWFGTHSTEAAINAGLDLEMPGPARFLGPKVAEAVAAGQVSPARVADAAQRVAGAAARLATGKAEPLSKAESDALLIEAAAAGFVLVRNEGAMLPLLPGSARRIAVIGPNAAAPCYQGGTFAKIAVTPDAATPIEAIRARYGAACEIVFEPGVDPQPRLPNMPVMPASDIGDGCTSGMTLEYFASTDCSGEPLTRETRATNSMVWFVGVHDQGRFDRPGSVRASGRFIAEQAGEHLFYLGATGEARLMVDGVEILRAGRALPASDVMGALKSGDAEMVAFSLGAGQEIHVTIEFRYEGARVQGLWYGIRRPDSAEAMLARAVAAARDADAVLLIVGETSDSSVESKDRPDTQIAPEQIALIEAITAANPRTAIIANVGHAFATDWEDRAAALLLTWYPGQGFGDALAEVLAGDREPGGRMPVTIARDEADYPGLDVKPGPDGKLAYAEGTHIGYRGLVANGKRARHPLGSGMGYARFTVEGASADGLTVTATVRNVSPRAGSEVLQLYRDTPECALIGFVKVMIAPGAEETVTMTVDRARLRRWQDGWVFPTGQVGVRLARSVEDSGIALDLTMPG
ncbi:glycoside hydrolase family 3 C-terminal domain-containing protein [Sphingomonas sp. RB3P16]|uniref:beta-glucosidase n=1 Tax=Parasphingomonas frigoris TaxID=3096163 RepID=UPI002FC76C09